MTRGNTVEELRTAEGAGGTSGTWPFFMLVSRTLLFAAFGFLFAAVIAKTGHSDPFDEVTGWWTFQVIGTNAVCFFLLLHLFGRDGIRYSDVIRPENGMLKKDLLLILVLIVPCGLVGYFGMLAPQVLLYGASNPPAVFYRPLPPAAAVVSLCAYPLSNALVETVVYFGYCLQRIEARSGNRILAVTVSSLFLALQHTAIPLYLDGTFVLWRFLSFVPFALFAGFVYSKTRRLFPLMVLHVLADLGTVVPIFIVSLNP